MKTDFPIVAVDCIHAWVSEVFDTMFSVDGIKGIIGKKGGRMEGDNGPINLPVIIGVSTVPVFKFKRKRGPRYVALVNW